MSYQQVKVELKDEIDNTKIKRLSDSAMLASGEKSSDWQAYLKWLGGYELQMTGPAKYEWVKTSDGNTPLPADE